MTHIFFLAFIQGLTEFLPISSQAHLILPSFFFNWPDQGPLFDVAVHVGSLGAIIFYLRNDIKNIATDSLTFVKTRQIKYSFDLFIKIVLASIPAVIFGYIIHTLDWQERRSIELIAYASIGFGLLLWWIDRKMPTKKDMDDLTKRDALLVGLAQCLAFIPGTSRSGATITASRLLGYDRRESARFSMLLAIPVIMGAGLLSALKLYEIGDVILSNTLFIAAGVSFAVSLASVIFMMKWLKNANYTIFVIYRVALGIIILAMLNS